ncbi:MAG: hypothetical protein R3F11_02700 [Verrucomicrobiales bacterium]
MAQPVLAEVAAPWRTAIVVGGSGLYVKALTHGLAEVPEPGRLARRHPRPAARAPPPPGCSGSTRRRIVHRSAEPTPGRARAGDFARPRNADQPVPDRDFQTTRQLLCGALLQLDRAALYTRINRRTDAMLTAGWIAEVASLPDLSATAEGAIGIRPPARSPPEPRASPKPPPRSSRRRAATRSGR